MIAAIPCPKCDRPMPVKKRITFEEGPAKLVYECDRPGCTGTVIVTVPARERS